MADNSTKWPRLHPELLDPDMSVFKNIDFLRLAKDSPIKIPKFDTIFYTPLVENNRDWFLTPTSQWKPNEYGHEEFEIKLLDFKVDHLDHDIEHALGHIHREMKYKFEKLRAAGIPVFIDGQNYGRHREKFYDTRLNFDFQIPEEFEYKYYFVLEEFDEAVRQSVEHASSKLWQFIEDYI